MQVQRHLEKLRKEKESSALVAIQDAFPDLGPAVCIVALEVRPPAYRIHGLYLSVAYSPNLSPAEGAAVQEGASDVNKEARVL